MDVSVGQWPNKRPKESPEGVDYNSEDDEQGQPVAGPSGTGKRKSKETLDKEQRKEQNRLAQREHRQRRADYIKELEARVELYSSSRDEQIDHLKRSLRALIAENHQLRNLLASFGGFLGEGLGGILSTVKLDLNEYQDLVSRHELDLARSVILDNGAQLRAARTSGAPENGKARGSSTQGESPLTQAVKRARTDAGSVRGTSASPYGDPPSGGYNASSAAPSLPTPEQVPNNHSVNTASALFSFSDYGMHSRGGGEPPTFEQSAQALDALMAEHPPGQMQLNASPSGMQMHPSPSGMSHYIRPQGMGSAVGRTFDDTMRNLQAMDSPRVAEAIALISYHLRTKRENPSYNLPPSLRLTPLQQNIVHDRFYDGIVFASLRDRLILCKDQYDFNALQIDLMNSLTIHQEDVLQPSNWELGESFMRKYWYVIDQEVLDIANIHRLRRGEPALSLRDLLVGQPGLGQPGGMTGMMA